MILSKTQKRSSGVQGNDLESARLFLGILVNSRYAESLKAIDKDILEYYLSGDGIYLSDVTFESERYLGKFISSPTRFEDVCLLEKNIYSLLKKLVLTFPYHEMPLLLFSIDKFEN